MNIDTLEPKTAKTKTNEYLSSDGFSPLFLMGDSRAVLNELPEECIDCSITSPPYFGHRSYAGGGIGQEDNWNSYVDAILEVTKEVKRVTKFTGSFWLNLGDSYDRKNLIGIPWRVAFAMVDRQGWILRNSIVWNKIKGGMDNSTDKLRNVHELVFHFVKQPKGYFYNVDAARNKPRESKVVKGKVISATGVSGVRYRRQIEMTTSLNTEEKRLAFEALHSILTEVEIGSISDFRMIIRGVQRATHSDSERVSGRARELNEKGFYFLKYHPNGSKLGDVWDILPEDTQKRSKHFAPFPEDLCRIPILTTCPIDGVVVDPFAGTGTTNLVAFQHGRKSIGIDISSEYIAIARERFGLFA